MKGIEYLPKFYERKDIKAKQTEIEPVIAELLGSGLLKKSEIEELQEFNIMDCADAYSRNYIIRRVNEIAEFVECRRI